jgi:hypothetical protein
VQTTEIEKEVDMIMVGIALVALIVLDILAIRFGASSQRDGGRNAWW